MGRIIGIDYGTKRCGVATTDPLQIVASALDTVETGGLMAYLEKYIENETVEAVVVGLPFHLNGDPGQLTDTINSFVSRLQEKFPSLQVYQEDERLTSVEAKEIIMASGVGKKKRREKSLVDKISAAIILEQFMKRSGKWAY